MKRKVSIYIIILFWCLSLYPAKALLPPQYTDNETYSVNGSVSRLIVKTFKAIDKFDHVDLGAVAETPIIIDFTDKGEWHRLTELDYEGNVNYFYVSDYNDLGQITAQKRYSGKGMMESYNAVSYAKDGKSIQQEIIYNAKGDMLYKENYLYNKAGMVSTIVRYNTKNEKIQSKTYTYTPEGNVKSESVADQNDNMLYKTVKTYDANNRIYSEESRDKNEVMTMKITYLYNSKGNIEMVKQTAPGKLVQNTRVEYEYDTAGNWIKRVLYTNDYFPSLVIMRQIEYK